MILQVHALMSESNVPVLINLLNQLLHADYLKNIGTSSFKNAQEP